MKSVFIFLSGVAVGCAAGMIVAKKKYDDLIKEEVKSVKDTFMANSKKIFRTAKKEEEKVQESVPENPPAKEPKEVKIPPVDYAKNPYIFVVNESEFGDEETYEKILLTLYSDNVLADDDDNKLTKDEIENAVSTSFMNEFVKSEEDVIYICNDSRKCYYEITKDLRPYHSLK